MGYKLICPHMYLFANLKSWIIFLIDKIKNYSLADGCRSSHDTSPNQIF